MENSMTTKFVDTLEEELHAFQQSFNPRKKLMAADANDEDSQDGEETTPCADLNSECSVWALTGECMRNAEHMAATCPRSCGLCDLQ